MTSVFEKLLIQEVTELRTLAQKSDEWTEFRIDIEVRGRVHSGELLIEFSIGEGYGDSAAKGKSLRAALQEFVRRKDWNSKNQPLMISYTGEKEEASDDIPF